MCRRCDLMCKSLVRALLPDRVISAAAYPCARRSGKCDCPERSACNTITIIILITLELHQSFLTIEIPDTLHATSQDSIWIQCHSCICGHFFQNNTSHSHQDYSHCSRY